MLKRVISGLVGLPILVAIVYFGGLTLFLSVMVVSLIGLREFYRAMAVKELKAVEPLGYLSAIMMLSSFYYSHNADHLLFIIIATFMLLSIAIILKNDKYNILDGAVSLIGVIYVAYFLGHVILISKEANAIVIWLVFITAFGSDTLAYFSGYFFGKRKLCPSISPKKTVEGAIGGTIGTTIISGIFGYLFLREHLLTIIMIGLVGSILSIAGDLTASLIKRKVGIKDFGNIMPGHGGVLDRFDSIIFTAPVVYYFLIFIINRG